MNETIRTLAYVAAALVIGLVSWGTASLTGPRIEKIDPTDETGQPLFPDFKDALAARSLEIVEYDDKTLETRQFKVERDAKGVWKVPSHFDYPADAARQLEEAAASVIDLKKLGWVTDDKADHALYGVVEPSMSSAAEAAEGVGKRIKLTGEGGVLADFIVGKADPQKSELRFVRLPNQDRVYRVAVNTGKLSTRFQDWIEKDLLKLASFDIREVIVDDYSFDEVSGQKVQKDRVFLQYDGSSKWTMEDLEDGKELDVDKLNSLKSALDSLQIVDVRRKPQGLSADLRSDESFRIDDQAAQSLAERGFYLVPVRVPLPDGGERIGYVLFSNEGEILVACQDGVMYSLRFGEIAANTGGGTGGEEEDAEKAEDAAGDTAEDEPAPADPNANRYVFVTVSFDKSQIPEPTLPPLPGEEPADGPVEGEAAEPEADGQTRDAAGPEADEAEGPDEADGEPGDDCQPADAEEEADAAAEGDDEPEVEAGDAVAGPAEVDDADPADAGAAQPDAGAAQPDAGDPAADLEAERQAVETERQRLIDEYNDKVKKGEERVKELNARFADWYYVISDSVYKQIHLSREQMVKQAPLSSEGGAGALEGLDLPDGDAPAEPDDDGEAPQGGESDATGDDAAEDDSANDAPADDAGEDAGATTESDAQPEVEVEADATEPESATDESAPADDSAAEPADNE